MKKIPIAIAVIIFAVFAYNYSQAGSIEPQEMFLGGQRDVIKMSCQTATTTAEYIATGAATSTCQAYIADATAVDFRFMVNSTTTPSTLTYEYFVSDDDLANRNWFLVEDSLANNTLATSTHALIPYVSYHETGLNASYLRLNYAISGASADVYVEIVKDNQI